MKGVLSRSNIHIIIVLVFHRILDFKNGAGFLSWLHFFYPASRFSCLWRDRSDQHPVSSIQNPVSVSRAYGTTIDLV